MADENHSAWLTKMSDLLGITQAGLDTVVDQHVNRAGPSGKDKPKRPTYGNLGKPKPEETKGRPGQSVVLEARNGTWKQTGWRGGKQRTNTARGTYIFVIQDGKIYAAKVDRTLSIGHTELAKGKRVEWAGTITFQGGTLVKWDNSSGHYMPSGAGSVDKKIPPPHPSLPWDKFEWREKGPDRRPGQPKQGPQLPVYQGDDETDGKTPKGGNDSSGSSGDKSGKSGRTPSQKEPPPKKPEPRKSGTKGKGRVTVTYDFTGKKKSMKVKRITFKDYPSHKPGPITGFFKDRPVLKGLTKSGIDFGVSAAANKALGMVEDHFSDAVDKASKAFDEHYPSSKELRAREGLDAMAKIYRDSYDEISRFLKTFEDDGESELPYVEEVAAAFAYEDALINLYPRVQTLHTKLPDIKSDIEARSQILLDIGQNFEEIFLWIHSHALGGISVVYYQSFTFWELRNLFTSLGKEVGGLASAIYWRQRDYEKYLKQLDRSIVKINAELGPWHEVYDDIVNS